MAVGSDRAIAIHEAGHAVVGAARGLDMGKSNLGPVSRRHEGAQALGPIHSDVVHKYHPTNEELRRYSDLARHMWAGPVAEAKHNAQADQSSARDDIAGITKLSEQLFDILLERTAWMNDQLNDATNDVDLNWRAINKVADELLERGEIEPHEVRKIVESLTT